MVGDIFQPTHLLFVLVVALLVLGPKRLPEVGRTLGAGIRDFRQALSGETPDPPKHQDAEQVGTTITEPRHQPETAADPEVVWPEEAVGPASFDEPAEAATAEPASEANAEPAGETTAVFADSEPTAPATEVVSDPEPHTAALTDHEPAGDRSPVAESSDSPESHTDQSS